MRSFSLAPCSGVSLPAATAASIRAVSAALNASRSLSGETPRRAATSSASDGVSAAPAAVTPTASAATAASEAARAMILVTSCVSFSTRFRVEANLRAVGDR